jgi:hypothetical protein
MAIGPSIFLMMSASLILFGGTFRKYPPPLPFLLSRIPAFLNSSKIFSRDLFLFGNLGNQYRTRFFLFCQMHQRLKSILGFFIQHKFQFPKPRTSFMVNIPFFPAMNSAASTAPSANPSLLCALCRIVISSTEDL